MRKHNFLNHFFNLKSIWLYKRWFKSQLSKILHDQRKGNLKFIQLHIHYCTIGNLKLRLCLNKLSLVRANYVRMSKWIRIFSMKWFCFKFWHYSNMLASLISYSSLSSNLHDHLLETLTSNWIFHQSTSKKHQILFQNKKLSPPPQSRHLRCRHIFVKS